MKIIENPEVIPIYAGQRFNCLTCRCAYEIEKGDIEEALRNEGEMFRIACPYCKTLKGWGRPKNATPRPVNLIGYSSLEANEASGLG